MRRKAKLFINQRWIDAKLFYYRIKNRRKKTALVYTDSRGFEIRSPFNKKNPFSSYCAHLIKEFNAEVYICPEKHTTLIDFLFFYQSLQKKFDVIILHCGVVDFSRRPISSLESIYEQKKHKFLALGFEINDLVENKNFSEGAVYEGEKTASLYPLSQFEKIVLPKMQAIRGLIWIGCNKVILDWQGSYWKKRPDDINVIMAYSDLAEKRLSHVVSLSDWDNRQIKLFTDDNIHPNASGYRCIYSRVKPLLDKVLSLSNHKS